MVREDRTTYLATLLNGEDKDNFFGAAVTSEPVDQTLTVANYVPNSALPVTLDITLQGATDGQAHRVSVVFNGASIGEMDFTGQVNVTNTFPIESSLGHRRSEYRHAHCARRRQRCERRAIHRSALSTRLRRRSELVARHRECRLCRAHHRLHQPADPYFRYYPSARQSSS